MDALSQINGLLNQPNTFQRNLDQLLTLSQKFISYHEGRESIVGDISLSDELRPVLATIGDQSVAIPAEMDLILATVLKILLRKSTNRLSLGKTGMTAIVRSLNRIHLERNGIAAAEMCNVILNTCYDGVNVQLLIELDGVALLFKLLKTRDIEILRSALGAIQGLCYEPRGRQSVRQEVKVKQPINHKHFFHCRSYLATSTIYLSYSGDKKDNNVSFTRRR